MDKVVDIPGALGGRRLGRSDSYSSFKAREEVPGEEDTQDRTKVKHSMEVHVGGTVSSGLFTGISSDISCSYEFVLGQDWQSHMGEESGETQLAHNQMISEEEPSVVWNFPIDAAFLSTNISGWPRLSIIVRDAARNIVGYGAVYVPTREGCFTRYCRVFAPLASTTLGNFLAHAMSDLPEFYDARFSTACNGREATRVTSSGVVKVTFMVRIKGKESLGYE